MFENENHKRAFEFLSQGNFRKAHTLLDSQMSPEMGGLIWIDFLYLQSIVHPNTLDLEQINTLVKAKPEWEFMIKLQQKLIQKDWEAVNNCIYDEFELQNSIRKNILAAKVTESDIQRIIDLKNRPV